MLNMDEKVSVKNLCKWTVGFKRLDSIGDVSINANTTIRLTRAEVYAQVQSGNVMFCGLDGKGSHARIYITDAPTRIDLDFDSEDGKTTQFVVTDDVIKELFAIKTFTSFEKEVKDKIVTYAEKRVLADSVKKFKFNDYNKIEFIKEYTGFSVD